MPPRDFPAESPRLLLERLGLAPRKKHGQNFLHDRNIARKIVALAVGMGPPFLEIGPGLGALTDLLAAAELPAVAVELDRGFAAFLRARYEGCSVEVLEGDFLRIPDEDWVMRFPKGGTAVGNLPYSISSAILLRLIGIRRIFPRAVLMLQKEVVERLCAPPGGKEYGVLSVYLSVLSEVREEFPVPRTCFTPPPGVDSAVVTVRFGGDISDPEFRSLQTVVRTAFAHRRKKLRNAPARFLPGGTEEWCALLEKSGIDPGARAETVFPQHYIQLARLVSGKAPPGHGTGRSEPDDPGTK